jgi:uncharacterized membrane protein
MESSVETPPVGSGAPDEPAMTPPAAPPSPGVARRLRTRISAAFTWLGFEPPGRWLGLLTLFVLLDIVILSWIQIIAYNSFYTFSQDFGSFTQIFYTTTHDHLLLYYTSNIPAGSNGTFMAVHFAPLIFLLLPFYALAPAPTTLLVMKIVVLAAGAFPAYGIAHRRLGSPRWGFLLGAAYLFSPITMTLNWIDFDMEVFIPFFVLCAIYLLLQKRYFAFLVAWVLALSTIETAAPFLLVFGVLALLGSLWGPSLLSKEDRARERIALSMSIFLAVAWLALAYLAVHSYSSVGGTFGSSYARSYSVLQAQSFFDVIPQAVLHPGLAGAALNRDGSLKIVYLLMLFGCFAFLPVFGELRYLAPVLGWIGLAVLSNTPQEYSFGSQYLGYVSPFLFAGAVGGIVLLRPWVATHLATAGAPPASAPSPRSLKSRWVLPRSEAAILPGVVVIAVVVTVGVGNPLLTHPAAGLAAIQFGLPSPDSHTILLDRIMALIPPNAGVLTTDHLFPQLSDRVQAYVLPTAEEFAGNASVTYQSTLQGFIDNSSYVLLDFTLDPYPSELMQFFGNYSGFAVEAAGDGIFLLDRGWAGPPLAGYSSPSTVTFSSAPWAATKSKGVVVNPSTQTFEYPVPATLPPKPNVNLWNGPVVNRVIPGMYELNVSYLLSPSSTGPLFTVQASLTPTVIQQVAFLVTPSGRHYQYNFITPGGPPVNLTSVNVSGTAVELGRQTAGTASLIFDVSQLGTLKSVGATLSGTFWILVTSFSLTWLGPPSTFYSPN